MNERRREELARRLLEGKPEEWPEELRGLQVETHKMPPQLRAKLLGLSTANAPRPITKGRTLRSQFTRTPVWASAAAVLVAISIGVFLTRQSEKGLSAVAFTYVEGSVQVNAKRAGAGQNLPIGHTLSVGNDSVAMLSATHKEATLGARVLGNSELRLRERAPGHANLSLRHGEILASLEHTPPRVAEQPATGVLSISSPIAEASVVGTRFSVAVERNGTTRLTTFSGQVAYRRRWPVLEDLPVQLLKRDQLLSGALAILREASVVVKANSESVVEQTDFARRLAGVSRLEKALNEPEFKLLRGHERPSSDQIDAALRAVARHFPSTEARATELSRLRAAFGEPPVARNLEPEEAKDRLQSLESPGPAERDQRFAELRGRNLNRDAFAKEALQLLGKAPQEVVLKNGETLYGSVFGVDGRYRVYTAQGIRTLEPLEIEEIRFQ